MQRFKNILLVYQNTSTTDSALQIARSLTEKNKAKLTVVTMNNRSFFAGTSFSPDELPINIDEELVSPTGKHLHIEYKVLTGKPFVEIIREVMRNGYDLVIKSTDQPDTHPILFDSTDMHLLRKCPCPVWLVKPGTAGDSQNILAAVDLDYSEEESDQLLNRQIMEMSTSLACSGNSNLHFGYAWMVFGEEVSTHLPSDHLKHDIEAWEAEQKLELDQGMKQFQEEVHTFVKQRCVTHPLLQPHFHFIEGDVQDVIPQIASDEQIDLIIMGTVGRSGLSKFFMGNTAESILSRISCSILAIKPEGFISPVSLD